MAAQGPHSTAAALDSPRSDSRPPPLRRNLSSLRLLTELSRERISLRHLQSWNELYKPEYIDRNGFPSDSPMPSPAPCHDTGLTAFAQLAALRIGVRRTFVTIMSRQTEYVLVEATRTMSLQSDFTADEKDKSWLGTSCFTRSDGINDLALDGWRKARRYRDHPEESEYYYTEGMSPHWCIFSDLSLNESLQKRPFVVKASSARFFFSVPLRDSDGTVIGSLSMLDDKPRYGVSAAEMLFCEDLSDTIAQHVFGSTIAAQRQRSERLIQALGTFNNGGHSLRDWWVGQNSGNMERGNRRSANASGEQQDANFDHEFGKEDDQERLLSSRDSSQSRVGALARSSGMHRSRLPRSGSDGNQQAKEDRVREHVSGLDFGDGSLRSSQPDGTKAPRMTPRKSKEVRNASQSREDKDNRTTSKNFDSSTHLKNAYGRAGNLLRESMGAAGVVFFDASAASAARPQSKAGSRSGKSDTGSCTSTITTMSTSSDDSKEPTNSDTDHSDNSEQRSRACKVIGSSTQVQSSREGGRPHTLQLTERDLAILIKAYPVGKVFNYAVTGSPYSGSEESASGGTSESATATDASQGVSSKHSRHARMLRKVVGDARSIAFYPIYDSVNERYRSCLFTWTLHANRFFDSKEDMTYLSAFGHSLRAEISRIETIASDVAKGKFISSVSHELRKYISYALLFGSCPSPTFVVWVCSPLHGVLAGVELLQDSQLTPFQAEMTMSVAPAGRTLLDTVNHILDYSKISNLTRDQRRDRARVDAARHQSADAKESNSNLTNVDLARLTEEVLESVVSAHRFSLSFAQSSAQSDGTTSRPRSATLGENEGLSVVLDIEKRSSWTTPMTPGSWTRVLTNIVGNALKYTHEGMVAVRLFANETNGQSPNGNDNVHITLEVEDTGIGMTKDFISNGLFVPFRQADSHSAGTGLGLSIVKEVAKEFRGSVNVSSETGKGSTVTVKFAASFTGRPDIEHDDLSSFLTPQIPRHLRMLQLDEASDHIRSRNNQAIAGSLQRTASQWLGCEVSSSEVSTPGPAGSLYAISEAELHVLHTMRAGAAESLISTLVTSDSQLLIFGRSAASCQPEFSFEDFSKKPIYVHQPIGPRKLLRVIKNAKDSTITRQPSDFGSHSRRQLAFSPRVIKGDTPDQQRSGSYFELPRNRHSNASSSIVTPMTFMNAASAKTPDIPSPIDGVSQTPSGESAIDPDQYIGDTVLLVEDNAINMRLLTALMKKQNLPYDCAQDGLEALNKYKENSRNYFLILMDMNMPVMDGFESTAKIREFERKHKLRTADIAALTGVTSEEARTTAFDAGVNKYLTKPIQMKDLTKLVAETREAA